jgi:DNA-binding beta-propeller fold protein YncE
MWSFAACARVHAANPPIPLPNDSPTLLLVRGDGNLSGVGGETPTFAQGVTHPQGQVAQCARFDSTGYVRYPISGNLSSAEGTVEFWIRPSWNGNTNITRNFFQAGNAFNRGMLLSIDGANNLRFIQWGDDPSTGPVETNVERGVGASGNGWQAGAWYHFAATWKASTREMALYVDGVRVGSINDGISISSFTGTEFSLGALTGGGDPSQADFDEVRISNVMRTAGQIYRDYQAGLGNRVLIGPRGVAPLSDGGFAVTETDDQRVVLYSANGTETGSFGGLGSGNGQFSSPADVSTDASGNLYVVESGNHRVQVFDAAGAFVRTFGSFGTSPGAFNAPAGIFFDRNANRIYVADTGNHRVQRFLTDGTLDVAWGSGGIVGTTGTVVRGHSGFDRPRDIAVSPIGGSVYVADFGNSRLEVFDSAGGYQRTVLAVYRPTALAFDNVGTLYIAGDDPEGAVFPKWDGHLRVIRPGNSLITEHYTGGLDDLARQLGGVAIGSSGQIVFSDTTQGRLVKVAASLTPPLSNLKVDARGTSVTFTWRTETPSASSVTYGPVSGREFEVTDSEITRDHSVTATGLTPNTRLRYSVGFPDSFDGTTRYTPPDLINTGVAPGSTQFLRVKAAGLIYKDTKPGAGYTEMSPAQLTAARNRFTRAAEFYWRNSGYRLFLDITIIEVSRDITSNSFDAWPEAQGDLTDAGFGAGSDFDAVWNYCTFMNGNFGGGNSVFGRFVAFAQWVTPTDFVAVHEMSHSIDSLYHSVGLPKYEFNHGIWAIPGGLGADFSINGQILHNLFPANFTAVSQPFTKVLTAPDADSDGVPDSSPAGLTNPLPITEATLGTSTSESDSDGDGLSDLAESTALPGSGSNPLAADSDDDGSPDALDLNPAYRMTDQIAKATPSLDGQISEGDGWTTMTAGWGMSNPGLVEGDHDAFQAQYTTYAAWDDNALYLAAKGPAAQSTIRLDGSADNWFLGTDNYELKFRNDNAAKSVRINVGIPDLFRQIDDRGEFSEFFDTDALFTRPYNGRPFYASSTEGAGFPGRLVTEADITCLRGGTGSQQVWEARIPWSSVTGLRGSVGKIMALDWNIQGDRLFDTDHAAQIRLVPPASPEISVEDLDGTLLVDGSGNVDFGVVAASRWTSRTFTIRNIGNAVLNISGIEINGINSPEFVVDSQGIISEIMPNTSESFDIIFTPDRNAVGVQTAEILISSNDSDEISFDIPISGQALSTSHDTDGDGLNDAAELEMAALGFDWQVGNPSLVSALTSNTDLAGLYTASQIQTLHVDTPIISRQAETGNFILTLGLGKSSDLLHFDALPFTESDISINAHGQLEFEFSSSGTAEFYRIEVK